MKEYKADNEQVVPHMSWGMLVYATDKNPCQMIGTLGICTGITWKRNAWKIYVVPQGCVHASRYGLDFWEYYRGF